MLKKTKADISLEIKGEINNNLINNGLETLQNGGLAEDLIDATASQMEDLYDYTESRTKLRLEIDELNEDELNEFGALRNLYKIPAKQSQGTAVFVGDLNTQIPQGTSLIGQNGYNYITKSADEILLNTFKIDQISRTGTLATATSNNILPFANGLIVNISGFAETNFNGNDIAISVLNDYQFTYSVLNTGATNDANGSISLNCCFIDIYSASYEGGLDLSNGDILQTDIAGIENILVGYNGIIGSKNEESTIDFRKRVKSAVIDNRDEDSKSKIIQTIKNKFSYITHGAVLNNYNNQLSVSSILKVVGEDQKTRKITTTNPHYLKIGDPLWSLTGSNLYSLNLKTIEKNELFFVGKVYDDYSFSVFIGNTTDEDSTSSNMILVPYVFGISTLVLYANNNQNKQLTISQINSIKDYLDSEILSAFVNVYSVKSAITETFNLNISNIVPNLTSLKTAIENNIKDYIISNIEIGQEIQKSEIDFVIKNSYDNSNNKVSSFTTNLTGDVQPQTAINIIDLKINFI